MLRLVLIGFLLVTAPVGAQSVILDADFDDKTVDMPVGTGGPDVGEPTDYDGDLMGFVRSTPFATPSLELQDTVDFGARLARFAFTPQAEVTAGIVSMHMDLWFSEIDNYLVYVREHQFSALSFFSLRFTSGGVFSLTDAGGSVSVTSNSYVAGQALSLDIVFDMGAGTYDLLIDQVLVVDDEPHGVEPGRGVGSILLGTGNDSDVAGTFYVDNILVTVTQSTAVSATTLGALKERYRGSEQ
jgi:hypothetical protein